VTNLSTRERIGVNSGGGVRLKIDEEYVVPRKLGEGHLRSLK
jgi:hypothetical protein